LHACIQILEAPQATASEGLTWRLERDPNPRPSGRQLLTLPMIHTPQVE